MPRERLCALAGTESGADTGAEPGHFGTNHLTCTNKPPPEWTGA
jgi:hypothetical protein